MNIPPKAVGMHVLFILVQFVRPLSHHQRVLILVATSQHHPCKGERREPEMVDDRLKNDKLNNCSQEDRFRVREGNWLRHKAISLTVSWHCFRESRRRQTVCLTVYTRTNPWLNSPYLFVLLLTGHFQPLSNHCVPQTTACSGADILYARVKYCSNHSNPFRRSAYSDLWTRAKDVSRYETIYGDQIYFCLAKKTKSDSLVRHKCEKPCDLLVLKVRKWQIDQSLCCRDSSMRYSVHLRSGAVITNNFLTIIVFTCNKRKRDM